MNFKNWFKFQEEMTSTANVAHYSQRIPFGTVVRRRFLNSKRQVYKVPQIEENINCERSDPLKRVCF